MLYADGAAGDARACGLKTLFSPPSPAGVNALNLRGLSLYFFEVFSLAAAWGESELWCIELLPLPRDLRLRGLFSAACFSPLHLWVRFLVPRSLVLRDPYRGELPSSRFSKPRSIGLPPPKNKEARNSLLLDGGAWRGQWSLLSWSKKGREPLPVSPNSHPLKLLGQAACRSPRSRPRCTHQQQCTPPHPPASL